MLRRLAQSFPALLLLAVLLACGGAAPEANLAEGADEVRLGKADPPPSSVELGTVEATHGNGCGMYGKRGNFEGAYALLRNEGARLGADYVQIMTVVEPYSDGQCGHQEYKLTGVAYRLPPNSTSAESISKDQHLACVPGATQACLGAGACKGAHACKDDGAGFEPCDWGNNHN